MGPFEGASSAWRTPLRWARGGPVLARYRPLSGMFASQHCSTSGSSLRPTRAAKATRAQYGRAIRSSREGSAAGFFAMEFLRSARRARRGDEFADVVEGRGRLDGVEDGVQHRHVFDLLDRRE